MFTSMLASINTTITITVISAIAVISTVITIIL